jgi:hypothetical protein
MILQEQAMRNRFWKWPWTSSRGRKNAWGLAPDGDGWFLVGLGRDPSQSLSVHTAQHLAAPLAQPGFHDLPQVMQQAGLKWGFSHRPWQSRPRVCVGLAANQLLSGVLDLPVALAESEWQSEVQIEASRALGLEPEDISFDFQTIGSTDGLVIRLNWVACGLSLVTQLNQCVREVGGQLSSVEPAHEAASRAAHFLRGGLASVLTQSVQDWQFDASAGPSQGAFDSDRPAWVINEDWLQDALHSPVGPRLIASGLALRGLH